jgi:EmrB/QacA subfamily drug resistance transporter
MAVLDSNIVLIALPTIIRTLPDTTTFDGLWIVMGYILITATLLLSFGRLADMFGRVRLYNIGFAIFTIGSGLCSVAPNGLSLVLLRLVQGIGGALIFSNNVAILTDAFPPSERGRAIGVNTVAAAGGGVVGLVAGGVLTSFLGWRSIFWINLPIGAFATVWAYVRLKEITPPVHGEKLDPLGNAFFGIGLSLLLLGLTFGAISGFTATEISAILVGAALILAFVYAELHVKTPMMDLSLFRIRAFSAGVTSNLLAAVARGSVSLVLVFYFQGALLLDPLTAGLMLLPFTIAFISLGPISGYLSDLYGPRSLSRLGLLFSAAGMLWFSQIPPRAPYFSLALPMILVGVGGGLFVPPNISSIMNAVPVNRRGVASAAASTIVNTGFLLSLAISFVIMATSIPRGVLQAIFAGLQVSGGTLNVGVFVDSMHKIFLLTAAISLVAVLPSALRGAKPKETINYQTEVS